MRCVLTKIVNRALCGTSRHEVNCSQNWIIASVITKSRLWIEDFRIFVHMRWAFLQVMQTVLCYLDWRLWTNVVRHSKTWGRRFSRMCRSLRCEHMRRLSKGLLGVFEAGRLSVSPDCEGWFGSCDWRLHGSFVWCLQIWGEFFARLDSHFGEYLIWDRGARF